MGSWSLPEPEYPGKEKMFGRFGLYPRHKSQEDENGAEDY
jgi:hypothetical protein